MQFFSDNISKLSIFLINFYQQYISPYKGYCCAHRVLHGGDSCSQYVKNIFLEQNLSKAIQLSQKRFVECGEAAEILSTQKQSKKSNLASANLQRRTSYFLNRRAFIYLIIPAFFTFGLATPALANKGKAYGQCMKLGAKSAIREDQKDGKCGNEPGLYYGLCCLGVLGATIANEK